MGDIKSSLGFMHGSDSASNDAQRYLSQSLFPSYDLKFNNDRLGKRSVVPRHSLPKILPEIEPVVSQPKPEDIVNELLNEAKGSFMSHYKQVLDRLEI